jgi:integrase
MRKNTFAFTKTTIKDLPAAPQGKRTCYYDSKLPGLELRITDNGTKSFSVYRWINGRNHRVVLGRYLPTAIQCPEFDKDPLCVLANNASLTIEHARQLAAAVITHLTAGQDPLSERRLHNEITLGSFFNEYIESYARDHTKMWKETEKCFDRYLSHWAKRPINAIKRSEVQLLINKLGKENGKTTANRTLELLRAVINKGRQWSLVAGDNPAIGVTKFKLKPRQRFVYEQEFPKLLEAIEAESKQDIKDYILISLYSGVRKSNVLAMRWEHVDLSSATWLIPDTKNDTAQTILLTEPELEILRRRFNNRKSLDSPNRFEYVFPGTGKCGHLADPKKGWHRVLKRAGITDLHLHDLRRTLGSYMAMTGASLSVIGNALNHKDVSTTRKVYAHTAHEAERKAREVAHATMFGTNEQNRISKVVSMNGPASDRNS